MKIGIIETASKHQAKIIEMRVPIIEMHGLNHRNEQSKLR